MDPGGAPSQGNIADLAESLVRTAPRGSTVTVVAEERPEVMSRHSNLDRVHGLPLAASSFRQELTKNTSPRTQGQTRHGARCPKPTYGKQRLIANPGPNPHLEPSPKTSPELGSA